MFIALFRIVKFSLQDFLRNFWLSVATIIILILTLISINFLLTLNFITKVALGEVRDKIDVSIYFKQDVPESQIGNIKSYLLSMTEVKDVFYVSPEDALEKFKETHKDDPAILESLAEVGNNPFNEIKSLAVKHKPKMIIAGFTAYPRIIDWQKFKEIADAVGAFFMADIAHIAGLIIGGVHPSPAEIADVLTTTTHKTLRGPRGAMILSHGTVSSPTKKVERTKENIPTLIDRAIIPGLQGGPHNHTTAAIAVALYEASQPAFKDYARQIVLNAKTLADSLMNEGLDLVTAGTDNHLMVVDLTNIGVAGKEAEKTLDEVGITCNKNTVPFDTRSPFDPSGIRLGTPALTSRGFKEKDMKIIGQLIAKTLKNITDDKVKNEVKKTVRELTDQFPLYPGLQYDRPAPEIYL